MNAITVNYAEVGDDYLPISFGLGSKISFVGKTVYNSTITEILDTSCIILQGRDIGTTDIIVSSSSAVNRCLSDFTPGSTSWIEHIIPNTGKNTTTYIFYKSSDGYYYKMVENDQGKPVQEKYALYARILSAADNKNKYPYCEAKIETPVPLEISNGKVNAIINSKSVEIAKMESSLVVELENADGTPIRQTITENEYSIDTKIYDLNGINWTRDGQKVMSWLSNNKIVKSSMSTNGWTKTIKLLAGNNIVTIPRNKSTITVNFTFTNTYMPSFEWGGAYHNGFNDSTMSGNTLTIKNARQGSSINLVTFYTDSKTEWFTPLSIGPLPGSGTFNVKVNIPTPSATDTIKFTGWIDGKLEQGKIIPYNHGILPDAYTISNMNTENLSKVDITNEDTTVISGLLTYDWTSKQLKRHRQITQINKSNTGTRTTTIDDSRNPGTTSTDIYLYASNNNVSQTFNVTAKYNDIPYIVNGDNNTQGAINQVVSFKNTNYVYNETMKQLIKNLTNIDVTSLEGKKDVTYYDPNIPVEVQFPDITFSITVPSERGGGTVEETPSEGEVSSSPSTETTEEYTATINCTVTNFAVTQRNYAIKQNNTIINASLIYNIECKANDETSFTCTVTITKITIQNKEYTINNATGSQTKDVQTVTKQLFN